MTSIFLQLPGITGEAKHLEHKDEIEVEGWSWGMTMHTNRVSNPRNRSTPEFRQLTIHKGLDRSSPALMSALTRATNFSQATLTSCRMLDGNARPILTITMHDVQIAAISSFGPGGGELAYPEEISLDFSRVNVTFHRIDKSGVPQGTVEFEHDLKINK